MYDAYIARMADGLVYAFYYSRENGVCQRVYQNGRWDGATSVAVTAMPGFSANLGADSKFYILYKNAEGAQKLAIGDKSGYRHESGSESADAVVASSKGRMFAYGNVQVLKDDHVILFSQEAEGFGYREMNYTNETEFMPVHMGAGVVRYSALTTDTNVHFLYAVKSVFGQRLLYRKRHSAGLSAAITVVEGGNVDGCWVFMVKGRVFAAYMTMGMLYISISDDDGHSFRRPFKYRSKLCDFPVKAAYFTQLPLDENEFCAREVYVDSLNPWDVQVLPEVYPDFFTKPKAEVEQKPERQSEQKPIEPMGTDLFSTDDNWYGAEMSEAENLRRQVDELTKRLANKDRQLDSLKQEIDNQSAVISRFQMD